MSEGKDSGRKRVRFSDTPEVREFTTAVEPSPSKRRAADPMEALEGEIGGVCLAEGGGGLDAASAAASRRAARKHHLLAGFEEGGSAAGRAYQGDIESAEADYDDPEEMFNDAGIPFEPFHLKREREEGYFDEDGNYVEYKGDEEEDAWADGLANIEVDEEWLARVMGGRGGRQGAASRAAAAAGAGGEQGQELEPAELGPEEIRSHKLRIIDMLLPGESVLVALRRLAQVRQPAGGGDSASGTRGGASSSGGGQGSPASDPLTRYPRALSGQAAAMPPAVRDKFERLTDLSSLLMHQGEYSVHSMTREELERSIGAAAAGGGGGADASPVAAGGGAAAGGRGDAGQALAEQLLAAAGAAAEPAAAVGGSNGAANGTSGGGASAAAEDAAALATARPAVDAEEDISGDGGNENHVTPASAAAAQKAEQQQPRGSSPGQLEAAASSQRDASGDITMHDGQQQQQGAAAAAAEANQPEVGEQPQLQQPGAPGIGASAAAAAAGGSGEGGQQELDGFVLDSASGYLYNSQMGCYYDSEKDLFGDASSGHWFSYDPASGQYQLAS